MISLCLGVSVAKSLCLAARQRLPPRAVNAAGASNCHLSLCAGDNTRYIVNTAHVPKETDVNEQARLDRIERHIKRLAEVSAGLQEELRIARQLADDRARAVRIHDARPLKRPGKKKRR